ncbi:MAG: tRNA pseudouridine(55) synthase TruB [Candidatus Electryonea clarkiae]|nr:tRNA pseudouridine(55) synthase TruB [Candidatus Electryonea clarkiae]MDP8286607.1 tRNA pseudouridine(55) synthase TruB [Candidatus Electryonea clarkiae]
MYESSLQPGIIPISGGWWVLIDKPAGLTSFDVVAEVRRITGQKKVGHAGSLDPMATGLLVVAVGKATRQLDQNLSGGKVYQAIIRLGAGSSTWDRDAKWLLEIKPPLFGVKRIHEELELICESDIQMPPMFAALKRFGKPLYRLAHKNKWIERESRPVKIESIELNSFDDKSGMVDISISGGGGVYVRSIARELGIRLGVPSLLSELRRTEVGAFKIDDSVSLDRLPEIWSDVKV